MSNMAYSSDLCHNTFPAKRRSASVAEVAQRQLGAKQSRVYLEAVGAAEEFGANRLLETVEDYVPVARLYVYAFRGLDVYGPTLLGLREVFERREGDKRELRQAMRGLELLNSARYHPMYRDHRALATLRLYHEALAFVEESLGQAQEGDQEVKRLYLNFLRAVEGVTSGNGVFAQNWKRIPEQTSTSYSKVDLEISRLVAGEVIGVYRVTVRAKGRVPHHSHAFLDEHHFLPDAIDGIHQIGDETALCTQSDIVYMGHGNIHAFRNDEEEDRVFLFVCGSRETGPWDFVQDITTYPQLDFPEKVHPDVQSIGGHKLADMLADSLGRKREKNTSRRLTPESLALFHDLVCVEDEFSPAGSATDLQYYVANGSGEIELDGNSKRVAKDDVFVLPTDIGARIVNRGELVLYQFGRRI